MPTLMFVRKPASVTLPVGTANRSAAVTCTSGRLVAIWFRLGHVCVKHLHGRGHQPPDGPPRCRRVRRLLRAVCPAVLFSTAAALAVSSLRMWNLCGHAAHGVYAAAVAGLYYHL